jgi:hypothetical protein
MAFLLFNRGNHFFQNMREAKAKLRSEISASIIDMTRGRRLM